MRHAREPHHPTPGGQLRPDRPAEAVGGSGRPLPASGCRASPALSPPRWRRSSPPAWTSARPTMRFITGCMPSRRLNRALVRPTESNVSTREQPSHERAANAEQLISAGRESRRPSSVPGGRTVGAGGCIRRSPTTIDPTLSPGRRWTPRAATTAGYVPATASLLGLPNGKYGYARRRSSPRDPSPLGTMIRSRRRRAHATQRR